MNKPVAILQSPLASRSGYGELSRDIAHHLIDMDKFDVKLVSTQWGATPLNALDSNNPDDKKLIDRVVNGPIQLQEPPALYIQATIPNEFMAPAKVNIGYTAGIETNMCSETWIDGCQKMSAVWGTSQHAIQVLKDTTVIRKDPAGNVIEQKNVKVPLDVLHISVDTDAFKKLESNEIEGSINDIMATIKEKFCFLFVGQWVKGGLGEDRKNIGILVKTFCETFSKTPSINQPALVLKTSGADFSILDREEILQKIIAVKNLVGAGCPNVYVIHGDLTKSEMNSLYNHSRIKAHVSFTKGEGFGIPLLEASMSEKPIIASGWSGIMDFLNTEDAVLLGGELKPIEKGAVWDNILIPESSWFNVDVEFAKKVLFMVYKDYERFLPGAKKLARMNREKFSYDNVQKEFEELIKKYIPDDVLNPPKFVPLVLPMNTSLPTLKKIGE